MSFYRKPTPLETLYILGTVTRHSPFINQFVVEGTGHLDAAKWQTAIERAAIANPTCRLKLKGIWGWRYWDDNGPLPKLSQIDNCQWDGMSSENADFFKWPLNPRRGPTAEVILLHGETPRVVFRTHHGITDGLGTLHWIKEVFRALRDEPQQSSRTYPNEYELTKSLKLPKYKFYMGNGIPGFVKTKRLSKRFCYWQRLKWDGDSFEIVAKFIIAMATLAKKKHQGRFLVRIPASLRRHSRDKLFNMTNCTGFIDLEVTDYDSVQSVQAKIIDSMLKKQDISCFAHPVHDYFKWMPKVFFHMFLMSLKKLHEKCRYLFSLGISNIGNVEREELSYPEFSATDAFVLPITFESLPVFSVILMTSNTINATIGIPAALCTQDELREFTKDFLKTFHKLQPSIQKVNS